MSNISKVTQLVNGKARVQTQAHLSLEPVPLQPGPRILTEEPVAARLPVWPGTSVTTETKLNGAGRGPCRRPDPAAAVKSRLR